MILWSRAVKRPLCQLRAVWRRYKCVSWVWIWRDKNGQKTARESLMIASTVLQPTVQSPGQYDLDDVPQTCRTNWELRPTGYIARPPLNSSTAQTHIHSSAVVFHHVVKVITASSITDLSHTQSILWLTNNTSPFHLARIVRSIPCPRCADAAHAVST